MERQEINRKILEIIKKRQIILDLDIIKQVEKFIEKYPDQRFGQIISNYFSTSFDKIFPGNKDPFYEESITTLNRILYPRPIVFRGKDEDGNWRIGDLLRWSGECRILEESYNRRPIGRLPVIDPDTMGQYIGIDDINGTKIFEGDIVKSDAGVRLVCWGDKDLHHSLVIGNIHDNPKLI